MIIKLQIAGNIYITKVKKDQLDDYLNCLTKVLQVPQTDSVIVYEAEDNDLDIKKLVFKETALEAFVVLNKED